MTLVCGRCGSHKIEITEAEESTGENGFVESFKEWYNCANCDGRGTYAVHEDNSDTLTGCLSRVNGGVW
jgi:hypothetical protein